MSKVKCHNGISGAPDAIGPYSQATQSGPFYFLSGQVPLDPASGELVAGDISAQTMQVMKNISAVLTGLGLTLADVVKSTIFLTDLGNFQTVNQIYAEFLGEHRPARATVQVAALPLGAEVEIEIVAAG